MGSNKPPPTRGPFASIHNPNPGLHYGAPHPSSARELGKARELDQGIDMALSPTGRESPGHDSVSSSVSTDRTSQASSSTGCRNSTTSIDSGRGSSSTGRRSVQTGGQEADHIQALNIQQMLQSGVPDEEVLTAWLTDLHYEEYFHLFRAAGYDMPTISRMTPEDLTAIGIQNPAHRKRLKTEISRLNICDGLPEHLPGSLEEWLRLLRLEDYLPSLREQGYTTVHQVATINIEDLEDTGFYRLGHQKRLVLAIRRLKDLGHRHHSALTSPPHSSPGGQGPGLQGPSQPHFPYQPPGEHGPPVHYPGPAFSSFHTPGHPAASPFLARKAAPSYPAYPAFHPGPPDTELPPPMPPLQYPLYPGSPRFTPRAAGGLGHPPEPSPLRMMRSYDDADILRHTDHSVLVHAVPPLGGETLPRLKASQRPRPVAKIIASTRESQERLQESEDISSCDDWKAGHQGHQAGHRSTGSSPCGTLRRQRNQEPIQLKRNSSFDSESGIPFANEKAGTIRMRSNSAVRMPERPLDGGSAAPRRNAGDVLHDIGSMLSDLTDELDAMLKLDREEP